MIKLVIFTVANWTIFHTKYIANYMSHIYLSIHTHTHIYVCVYVCTYVYYTPVYCYTYIFRYALKHSPNQRVSTNCISLKHLYQYLSEMSFPTQEKLGKGQFQTLLAPNDCSPTLLHLCWKALGLFASFPNPFLCLLFAHLYFISSPLWRASNWIFSIYNG